MTWGFVPVNRIGTHSNVCLLYLKLFSVPLIMQCNKTGFRKTKIPVPLLFFLTRNKDIRLVKYFTLSRSIRRLIFNLPEKGECF